MDVISEIIERRKAGRVTCAIHRDLPEGPLFALGDAVLVRHSLRALGSKWKVADRATAEQIATALLHRDLAYTVELMPLQVASTLASRFTSTIESPCRFLTNLALSPEGTPTIWEPSSPATFDGGIVGVAEAMASVLWVEDED
ncbi:MAG: hypothetical protein HOW73_24130 [Polyangiaceae bacterium]|nr:hypothetical protein [Polyangiaceae bacterium]